MHEELDELIDQYIRGKLSPEDQASFEQRMKSDPTIHEKIALAKLELDAMELIIEKDLRQQINNWKKPKRNIKKYVIGLSSLALIIIVILWYFYIPLTQSSEKKIDIPKTQDSIIRKELTPVATNNAPDTTSSNLADDNTKLEPDKKVPSVDKEENEYLAMANKFYILPSAISNLRSIDGEDDSLNQVLQSFQRKEYRKTIEILTKSHNQIPANNQANELLAHAYFKTGQFAKASAIFNQIVTDSPVPEEEAEWYLLLSLLPQYPQDSTRIIALTNTIAQDQYHSYQKPAQQIAEYLKSH